MVASIAAAAAPAASHAPRGMAGDPPMLPADRDQPLELPECRVADDVPGAQVLGAREGRVRTSRDDLGDGGRPDPGQRVELCLRRPVQVDRARLPPAASTRSRRAAEVPWPMAGTTILSPSVTCWARLSSDAVRVRSAFAANPPARTSASPTRPPAGTWTSPGRATAPSTSTTSSSSGAIDSTQVHASSRDIGRGRARGIGQAGLDDDTAAGRHQCQEDRASSERGGDECAHDPHHDPGRDDDAARRRMRVGGRG